MKGILNQPDSIRRWALGIYWSLMYLATHWPDIDEWAPRGWNIPFSDKLTHTFMYGGWMALWCWVLVSRKASPITRPEMTWLLAGGALYAAFDEITQAIVDRHPSIADWTCDLLGLLIVALIVRVRTAKSRGLQPARP